MSENRVPTYQEGTVEVLPLPCHTVLERAVPAQVKYGQDTVNCGPALSLRCPGRNCARGAQLNAYPADATSSCAFQMQRIGAELRFSATVDQEPEVELELL